MNLTARQIELLNSTNPQDNAELLASLGGDEQLLHQLVNMYGPTGGNGYNGNQYGMTASNVAQSAASVPESIKAYYKSVGIMDANGNFLKHQDNDGNWVAGPPGGSYSAANNVNPGSSWSGVNASGGFAGGTGTGVTSGAFNSTTGAPMTYEELMGALNPSAGNRNASGAGPGGATRPNYGGGTSLSTLARPSGGAPGSGITPRSAGAAPGGSTANGNTGDTGGFPMASAVTYNAPTPYTSEKYTPPEDVTKPFDFYNDEGYKFALGEGIKGIENSAAARGGLQSGNTLKSLANYQTGLASQYYDQAFNRQMQNKNFNQNVAVDARNYNNANNQWGATFNNANNIDARNYNNANRMWDTTFNNNNRIDARNFDYTAAIGDRNFNEDQRRYDQNFNYNAATGDRNFDAGILGTLYNGGLTGASGTANLANVLATLLSSNTMTGAGAGAAGTVGGATSIQSMINSILNSLYTNKGRTSGGDPTPITVPYDPTPVYPTGRR